MQARARSMAADERELNKAAEGCDIYHDLGLPPGEITTMVFWVMFPVSSKQSASCRSSRFVIFRKVLEAH